MNQLQRASDREFLLKSASKETFRYLKNRIDLAFFHVKPGLKLIYSSSCKQDWKVKVTNDWFKTPVAIPSVQSYGLLEEDANDYIYSIEKIKYRCILVSFPSFKYYKRTQITQFFENIHGQDELLIGAYYPVEPRCIRSSKRKGKYEVLFPIDVIQ